MFERFWSALALACALFSSGCTYTTIDETLPGGDGGLDEAGEDVVMRDTSNPNEKVQGGWSASGPLQQFVSTNRVKLQANFDQSEYYTCQFSVTGPQGITLYEGGATPGPVPYPFYFRAVATVKWAIEGNVNVRTIDIGNGTAISGPGQGVTISVEDATDFNVAFPLLGTVSTTNGLPGLTFTNPQSFAEGQQLIFPDDPTGTIYTVLAETSASLLATLTQPYMGPTNAADEAFIPLPYTVTVTCSVGTRPNPTVPPTLFGGYFTLAAAGSPGNTINLFIPAGSGANAVEVVGTGTPKLDVLVIQETGGSIQKPYDPTINVGFVTLLPNAASVSVQNLSANPAEVLITWGVDG